jgi:hypothetical protein
MRNVHARRARKSSSHEVGPLARRPIVHEETWRGQEAGEDVLDSARARRTASGVGSRAAPKTSRLEGWRARALWRLEEEPGVAGVRLERDEFEPDETPLNERQRGEDRLCVQQAVALENEHSGVTVGAEVGFTDETGLVEAPERAGLVFEVRREIVSGEAGSFDFEREDLHGWTVRRWLGKRSLGSLASCCERRRGASAGSAVRAARSVALEPRLLSAHLVTYCGLLDRF